MIFEVLKCIFATFCAHGGSLISSHVSNCLYCIAHLFYVLGFYLYAAADTLHLTTRLVD